MKELTCILCPNSCTLSIEKNEMGWKISGNLCPRGKDFAIDEMEHPKRSITTTVKTIYKDIPRLPVKTDGEIPKEKILSLMGIIDNITVSKIMNCGDIILENILNSGVNLVATSNMEIWIKGV